MPGKSENLSQADLSSETILYTGFFGHASPDHELPIMSRRTCAHLIRMETKRVLACSLACSYVEMSSVPHPMKKISNSREKLAWRWKSWLLYRGFERVAHFEPNQRINAVIWERAAEGQTQRDLVFSREDLVFNALINFLYIESIFTANQSRDPGINHDLRISLELLRRIVACQSDSCSAALLV